MSFQNRKTVLALMKESVEGTPVPPGAATDFIALQSGFTMEPNTETLENEELRSSIGDAKPIAGSESPTASFNHYLRHSGTEGQAPNFGKLLEAAFGSTTSNSTERATTTDSTTSVIKLAAGGSDFARGKAVLLKDSTNGYSIRAIKSVATNDLTPAFDLANAPGSGVNCGKCVNYAPANEGHPSLSAFIYRGNGGALEVGAGYKVSSFNIEVTARRLINMSFQLQGSAYMFNPIYLAANKYLDFEDDGGDKSIVIPAGWYKDPNELAATIQDLLDQTAADEITVKFNNTGSDAGKFTFTSDGETFKLKFNTGSNSANTIASYLGFSADGDKTGATTYKSDNAISYDPPYTPSYDNTDPLVAKDNEVFLGSADSPAVTKVSSMRIAMTNSVTSDDDLTAKSGISSRPIERRSISIDLRLTLDKHQAEYYTRYRQNDSVAFMWNFGVRNGTNWIAGKCGNVYAPDAVISRIVPVEEAGLVKLDLGLRVHVDSNGNGEFYMNFV